MEPTYHKFSAAFFTGRIGVDGFTIDNQTTRDMDDGISL
jgi:hypothetical protein